MTSSVQLPDVARQRPGLDDEDGGWKEESSYVRGQEPVLFDALPNVAEVYK